MPRKDYSEFLNQLPKETPEAYETWPEHQQSGLKQAVAQALRDPETGDFKVRTERGDDYDSIFLYGPISSYPFLGMTADAFMEGLDELGDPSRPLQVNINCPGGSVADSMAMLAALDRRTGPITANVDGFAFSAAINVLMAASVRRARPTAMLLVHEPRAAVYGPSREMDKMSQLLQRMTVVIAEDYASVFGGTAESWQEVMAADEPITGREGLEQGIITELLGSAEPDQNAVITDLAQKRRDLLVQRNANWLRVQQGGVA